jgi:hypothetical protein
LITNPYVGLITKCLKPIFLILQARCYNESIKLVRFPVTCGDIVRAQPVIVAIIQQNNVPGIVRRNPGTQ